MANIRINQAATVVNGQTLTFKSPADCSQITGLIVYYPVGNTTTSKTFKFVDAHGNNVGSVSLFAANVLVKVILDTDLNRAYVQNADTNAYLEAKFESIQAAAGAVPLNHASSETKYGTGNDSTYGHVKLSNATNSTSGASGGIAATPAAVKAAYDLAKLANDKMNAVKTETWIFTLENGQEVPKVVYVG